MAQEEVSDIEHDLIDQIIAHWFRSHDHYMSSKERTFSVVHYNVLENQLRRYRNFIESTDYHWVPTRPIIIGTEQWPVMLVEPDSIPASTMHHYNHVHSFETGHCIKNRYNSKCKD